jgi:protein-S-isoprenylcysteine O-methyltransferase Ste14
VNGVLFRAILAFLALPGVVAFAVPLLIFAPADAAYGFSRWGLVPLLAGVPLLLWCTREFYVAGRGTLAPWMPPQQLVTSGPYRYSRNPMYVAVTLILSGWALGFRSWPLALYALAVLAAFHVRVSVHEEPFLARAHGAEWTTYRARVPRWWALRAPHPPVGS